MLVWIAAYDRTNYARYLPVYILDMDMIAKTSPGVHQFFVDGGFVVQRSHQNFTSIAHDQTIETTINLDTKTPGGLIGKTLRHDSVCKWIWTAADKAQFYESAKNLCEMQSRANNPHKDGSKSRILKDELLVRSIVDTISNLVNPFIHQQSIMHITSGKHAPDDIERDLLRAKDVGTQMVKKLLGKG